MLGVDILASRQDSPIESEEKLTNVSTCLDFRGEPAGHVEAGTRCDVGPIYPVSKIFTAIDGIGPQFDRKTPQLVVCEKLRQPWPALRFSAI